MISCEWLRWIVGSYKARCVTRAKIEGWFLICEVQGESSINC